MPDAYPNTTVGAGNHFSVFFDPTTNTLYSSGENVVAQLGNGTIGFDVKTPLEVVLPIAFDEVIISVSAGLLHSTFLTETGDVYAFGFNNRGPLGLGDEESRTEAVEVTALENTNIKAIANGNSFSFAIEETGKLYGWGSNSNGQLGLGDLDERLEPVLIDFFADKPVVTVAPGNSHTLVLTEDGSVYAMGAARDGQLGSPDALDEDGSPLTRVASPLLVEGLSGTIVAISAFTKTSFAVTDDGRVFGWGESRNGQLLQGENLEDGTFEPNPEDILAPIELTDFMPSGVIDIKGGARWAVALTEDGDVYAWGPNDQGPTGGLDGAPEIESDVSFYPTKIAALDDVTIVEITTGPNSIIAVTDKGQIFTWGSNSDGRLGYETDGSVYIPQEVILGGDAGPYLAFATPGDGARDVSDTVDFVLSFTEEVKAGVGILTIVSRETGDRTEIDLTSDEVSFDGSVVTINPTHRLDLDSRYYVEISEGAFVDLSGKGWSGIETGDTSTFNFTTAEVFGGNEVLGDEKSNRLLGTDQDDLIVSGAGRYDRMEGGAGADGFVFGAELSNGVRERNIITDYQIELDFILLQDGAEVSSIRATPSQVAIIFEGDRDILYVRGEGVSTDTITIISDPLALV